MSKSKGTQYERELIHKVFEAGHSAIRAAGSGSQRAPAPDVLALIDDRIECIEAKYTREGRAYIQRNEAQELKYFTERTENATALAAIRKPRKPWAFIPIENAPRTKKANNITMKYEGIQDQGYSFNDIIQGKHRDS